MIKITIINGVKRTWNNMKKAIRGKWCTFCIMGQRVIEIYKSKGKQKWSRDDLGSLTHSSYE